ncbi:hypothetical protein [Paraburkholderia sp. BCC1884]|uniref:hypothetical protein n=1 Tax=Paraburkholderia sp. BCC1884 TaxID=2562668 RepID=UPI001183FEAD|nr:hypothetical protein [Paraburkholderia sp. BCC1884]
MLSDITSDQHDPPRCGHCGALLAGHFARCPACDTRPAEARGAHARPASTLKVPLGDPDDLPAARLPVRKIWTPSSRALTNRYELLEEPVVALTAYQKLRQPLVLSASVLVVTSAVYLGFIHSNDSDVGTPIAVSGKVQAQNGKPSIMLAQKPPASVALAARPATVAQRPAPAATPRAAATVAQRPAPTVAQKIAPTLAQRPAPSAVQRPATVAAQRSSPVRSSSVPAPSAPAAVTRRVAMVTPETKRGSGNAPDKPRADVSRHIKAARADLQENNLSATKARLAAAIAVQPDNRDALTLRTALGAREQQRDALLSLARGCGYIARWNCVWHNAGNALMIDSSSKEAQRLVSQAMHESEMQVAQPVEPAPEPVAADPRDLTAHH